MRTAMRTIALILLLCSPALAADYAHPIIAVRSRMDDLTSAKGYFPEAINATQHPVSDLALRKPDGSLEVLLSGNGADALFDPKMSLDGQWCYYVKMPTCAARNTQRGAPTGFPLGGSDIYRINLATKQIVRLTDQKWMPPTSVGPWRANASERPTSGSPDVGFGYGVCNLAPCPLPGGKLAFTSNRNGYEPPKGFAGPQQQLFVMDDLADTDGEADRNVECTGHLNVSSALHPVLMMNGEIMYSSHEDQGLRDARMWGIWKMKPDGRGWGPVYSAYSETQLFHFQAQRSDGSLSAVLYYNLNNWGFGALLESPPPVPGLPEFLSPKPADNPPVQDGHFIGVVNAPEPRRYSTMRRGMYSVTPWAPSKDYASGHLNADGTFTSLGKVTHPAGAPDNSLLVTYSPGNVNALGRPVVQRPHSKVGLIAEKVTASPTDIEILLEHPDYHFTQPIAAVPWSAIYPTQPVAHEFCPNTTGTPYGRLQLSSSYLGQWKSEMLSGAVSQGHWSGHPQAVPAGIDIVAFEPVLAATYWRQPDSGWSSAARERVRLLARVMFDEADRPAGDTSVDMLIPADVPYGMRTFAADGRTITFSQTWKQTRPGEVQQCGGCHNHSGDYIKFEGTYASLKAAKSFDRSNVRTPEFNRDVKPILAAKCQSCHNESHPVKLDESLAKSIYVKPSMAYASRLSKAIHGEGDTQRMPLGQEPLTDAEIRTIDEWIDYFCLVSQHDEASKRGAFSDITKPTLYVPRSGPLKIGVEDYLSGVVSVTLRVNGVEQVLPAPVDGVYSTAVVLKVGDRVVATATDGAGNIQVVERFVGSEKPPVEPPPLGPTIEELRAKIDAAKALAEQLRKALD